MEQKNRFAGVLIILGSLLNLTRLIPIFLNEEVDFSVFPPDTVEKATQISLLPGWLMSHVMGFISAPLLIVGFIYIYKLFHEKNSGRVGLVSTVLLSFGMALYGIAVGVDGILLPQSSIKIVLSTSESVVSTASMLQTFAHELALMFGSLSLMATLVGAMVLGFSIYTTFKQKTIGTIGVLYGVIGILMLLTDVIDVYMHKNFMIGAGAIFAAQAWYLLIGIRMYRGFERT